MNNNLQATTPVPDDQPPQSGFDLLGNLKVSVIATFALAVLVSGIYPAVVWGLAQLAFSSQANGSLIGKDGKRVSDDKLAIGSALIGQNFSDGKYFHPRASAAGYDPTQSQGSNLGPTSAKLMFGTTKLLAYTIFAADKAHLPMAPVNGRVQGTLVDATKTTISLTPTGATAKATYLLDAAAADPNTVVSFHGRTIHVTTLSAGQIVELKLNDKTPPAVTAINVVDQELDGMAAGIDTTANKITLSDLASTVINFDPKNTVFVVNGKADAKPTDLTTNLTLHAVVSMVVDFDGIADRVIHYCQDNKIAYHASVPDTAFTDADGIDDLKLNVAFNAATLPTITPAMSIPADAVTASASGLDPHISVDNARIQAGRVADARKLKIEKVNELIEKATDSRSLGLIGEPGVNVLRLNLALDQLVMVAPTTNP